MNLALLQLDIGRPSSSQSQLVRICTLTISGTCAVSLVPAIGVSLRSFRAHLREIRLEDDG